MRIILGMGIDPNWYILISLEYTGTGYRLQATDDCEFLAELSVRSLEKSPVSPLIFALFRADFCQIFCSKPWPESRPEPRKHRLT